MSIPATTTFGNPDPAVKFTTVSALVALLRALVSTVLPNDLTPYVTGSATPSVDDQDKIWHRYDAQGRPKGTYKYYNGLWRREEPGLSQELRVFYGDPVTAFDADGRGIRGGDWDGWQLMNGKSGTADLSNRFIISGNMNDVGFAGFADGLWRTNVLGTPATAGGVNQITLNSTNTYRAATAAVQAAHYSADGNTREDSGGIYGQLGAKNPDTGNPFDLIPSNAGNESPEAINIMNPFYAMAYAQWVGFE